MRIFLLDKAFNGNPVYSLKSREKQYLVKVLRFAPGFSFAARSVDGTTYKATVVDEDTLSLEQSNEIDDCLNDQLSGFNGKFIPITVYQCICKGKKNEAGVENIVFVKSLFCQTKEITGHDWERLECIVKEAVQQSGARTNVHLTQGVDISSVPADNLLILHQSLRGETKALRDVLLQEHEKLSILIGSEGGLSDEECEVLERKGATSILLPTNILRAETAGIYTVGAIQTMLNS